VKLKSRAGEKERWERHRRAGKCRAGCGESLAATSGTFCQRHLEQATKWCYANPTPGKGAWRQLTDDEVSEMRVMRAAGATLRECAERFGVSTTTASNVVNFRVHNGKDGRGGKPKFLDGRK
jgi:hypothetical protein